MNQLIDIYRYLKETGACDITFLNAQNSKNVLHLKAQKDGTLVANQTIFSVDEKMAIMRPFPTTYKDPEEALSLLLQEAMTGSKFYISASNAAMDLSEIEIDPSVDFYCRNVKAALSSFLKDPAFEKLSLFLKNDASMQKRLLRQAMSDASLSRNKLREDESFPELMKSFQSYLITGKARLGISSSSELPEQKKVV